MAEGRGSVLDPESLSQGQLVALTCVTLVLLLLLTANMAVFWLYRRAAREDGRQRRREERSRTTSVWQYRVHRTFNLTGANNDNSYDISSYDNSGTESGAQQILRKLQASHDNLRAKLAWQTSNTTTRNNNSNDNRRDSSLWREEAQALEELEVMTDLFLHDTASYSSSRCSSLTAAVVGGGGGSGGGRGSLPGPVTSVGQFGFRSGFNNDDGHHRAVAPPGSTHSSSRRSSHATSEAASSTLLDLRPASTLSDGDDLDREPVCYARRGADLDLSCSSYDLEVASALADLDLAAALHDLDPDTDQVSMCSVTMADFVNDDDDDDDDGGGGDFGEVSPRRRKKRSRRSSRRSSNGSSSSGRGGIGHDWGDHSPCSLPVAEFHNEAFDFSETRAALERMKDVEL